MVGLNSGDMVKAFWRVLLVLWLDQLSGTLETPGEIKGGMKRYRGMAQEQVSWRGASKGMTAKVRQR